MDTVIKRTCEECSKNGVTTLQPGSAFSCGTTPKGFYELGGGIFVYANQWKKKVLIHIRKFKKFANAYYPSSAGMVISPQDFTALMKDGFDRVRQSMDYWIQDETCQFTGDFDLHVACTTPEKTVTLTRQSTGENGRRYLACISLTHTQWTQFEYISDCVSIDAVKFIFKDVDIALYFETFTTPSTLESDKIYNNELLYYLKAAFITILHKCGMLEYSEEETKNTIAMFNEACLKLNMLSVMCEFYYNTSMVYLKGVRQLSTCVNSKFLKEVELLTLIHEIRIEMCCLEQYV